MRRFPKSRAQVSVAALMLGVSPVATVGFNFQANYCYAAAYSGMVVSAPAFGIGPASWESLSPLNTVMDAPWLLHPQRNHRYHELGRWLESVAEWPSRGPLPQRTPAPYWVAISSHLQITASGRIPDSLMFRRRCTWE